MSSQSIADGSIGPTIDLEQFRLPPHVGARLATLFGQETPIETGVEWTGVMRRTLEARQGREPTEDDLCHAEDGAHTVTLGDEESSFVCVLDPLLLPFLRDEPGRIESSTPEGEQVVVEIADDGVAITPDSAVVSLGVSHHVDADEPPTREAVYRQVCGYVHVFATPAEYERWAADVDAATTTVSAETGVAVARAIAATLFTT